MKKQKESFKKRLAILASFVLGLIAVVLVVAIANDLTVGYGVALAIAPIAFMVDGKFKELSDEQFKELTEKGTPEEVASYLLAQKRHREAIIADLQKDGKKNADELVLLKGQFNELIQKQYTAMEEILKKQGLKLQELMDETKVKESQSTLEQIKSELTKNKENLMSLKAGKPVEFTFGVKTAATTILESSNLTGQVPAAMRIAGFNAIAQRMPFILDLISQGSTNSNLIEWVYEVAMNGGAGYTTEGSAKNLVDSAFVVDSEKIQKLTVRVRVSEEMLTDIDFMASYINDKLLNQKLTLKLDAELLSGAGGGSAINGIITQSTAWAAGASAGLIVNANERDVLDVAITQIEEANFNPTVIILRPADVLKLKLAKNLDGDYLFPELRVPGGAKELCGVKLVTNTGMEAGKFLVMDGTKATAYFREGISVKTGWSGEDFEKNLRTIIAEVRVALVIENNDLPAFVYGDFATSIAAIDKVIH